MATPVQLRRMVRYIFPMGKHSPRAGWCILLLDRYNHVFLIFILIDKHNHLLDFLSQLIAMKMWVMDSHPECSHHAWARGSSVAVSRCEIRRDSTGLMRE